MAGSCWPSTAQPQCTKPHLIKKWGNTSLIAVAGKRDWDELTIEYGVQVMEGLSMRCPEQSEGTGTSRAGSSLTA